MLDDCNEQTVQQAREFARRAHVNQCYGDAPYQIHLQHVEAVLVMRGIYWPALRAAAWLHDVLEDTATSLTELESEFPTIVCNLVFAVTSELGANRKERNARTYPKIGEWPLAITLKIADRIANVEASKRITSPHYQMYLKEYPDFRTALCLRGGPKRMWAELDELMGYNQIQVQTHA